MDLGFYWLYGFGLSPDASINMQSGGEEPWTEDVDPAPYSQHVQLSESTQQDYTTSRLIIDLRLPLYWTSTR